MSEPNPYESPGDSPFESQSANQWDSSFEDASRSLAQTKPWVTFLSILGFIVSALMLLVFPVLFLGDPGDDGVGRRPASFMIFPAIVLSLAIFFYLIPSILLWRYRRRIGQFLKSRNPSAFAEAIAAQKSFWQYIGILVLLGAAFYIILGVFVSILGAM